MQKFFKLFIGGYILLLNASYAQQNLSYPAEVLNLRLDQIQFKATHNSYFLDHPPAQLIDHYNVWEIELDFGILRTPPNSSEFIVGHNYPEPKHGLRSLRDWVLDITLANSLKYHPIILKLEAKTKDSCNDFDPTCDWDWATIDKWGDWQDRLFRELRDAIGLENWFTSAEYKTKGWLSAQQLKGKFIIMLIDNNGNNDIQYRDSPYFFIGDPPQLTAWSPKSGDWRPIKNATDFGYALKKGFSRLIMDGGYQEPWSNVLVHSSLPSIVNSSYVEWHWGTVFEPFQTIGHAINASWTGNGDPTHQIINIFSGNYSDKVTISTPTELHSKNGTVTIGGKNVAYTVTLTLMDEHEAGTNSPVYVRLHGDKGSTGDHGLVNPKVYLDRAGAETFWITAADVGVLQSITIGVLDDDDMKIDDIIVVSATTGRKKVHVGDWVGDQHGTPKTFNF
jgi:hypothetical protein